MKEIAHVSRVKEVISLEVMNKTKILITGGVGFIGHHLVEHILRMSDWDIIILDRLDCSGDLNRLTEIQCWEEMKERVKFFWHDLKAPISERLAKDIGEVNYVIHLAASSHVDRSIDDPILFAMDNFIGTVNLLNWVRTLDKSILEKVINFSTDEIFGAAPEGVDYKEWDRFNPGNPYSASKAGAESMVDAFANTYKLPLITTHTMNVFGERQHPEKFIPKVIKAILNHDEIVIHANKDCTKPGKRFYIHARNVAEALIFILYNGECLDGSGLKGKYNIVGEQEVDNLELAQMIFDTICELRPLNELTFDTKLIDFHSSRPGHDLRYSLDGTLLASMGFRFPKNFRESLRKVVEWTLDHPEWL